MLRCSRNMQQYLVHAIHFYTIHAWRCYDTVETTLMNKTCPRILGKENDFIHMANTNYVGVQSWIRKSGYQSCQNKFQQKYLNLNTNYQHFRCWLIVLSSIFCWLHNNIIGLVLSFFSTVIIYAVSAELTIHCCSGYIIPRTMLLSPVRYNSLWYKNPRIWVHVYLSW